MPGGALAADRASAPSTASAGSSACTATPTSTSARSACARARSPAPPTASTSGSPASGGHTCRPAPDRGPHLRARQARHRAAGGALPPPRPARRRQRGVGSGRRPARAATSSPTPARVGGTVRMLDAVAWGDAEQLVRELSARSSSRTACSADGQLQARRAAGGQRARVRGAARPAPSSGPRRRGPRADRRRASAARTSPGTSTRVPGAMGRLGTRTPGRPDVRPPPGRPARRRAGHRRRRPRCSRRSRSTRSMVTDRVTLVATPSRPG